MELSTDSSSYGTPRHTRAQNYFQLLEVVGGMGSMPGTPVRLEGRSRRGSWLESGDGAGIQEEEDGNAPSGVFSSGVMAEGYFEAFFKEEYRLGMGANGSVFLCQVRPSVRVCIVCWPYFVDRFTARP